MQAAAKGHVAVLQSLLRCRSIDPNLQDKVIIISLQPKHTDTKLDYTLQEGMSALMLAVYEGHEAAARSLIEHDGVNLDLQNKVQKHIQPKPNKTHTLSSRNEFYTA